MAKFYGPIGFALLSETAPGIWTEIYDESHSYKGDILRRRFNWENSSNQNDDLNISMGISIISDTYAIQHFPAIRYIVWDGVRYEVTAAILQRPRIELSIGGVFNGGPVGTTGNQSNASSADV